MYVYLDGELFYEDVTLHLQLYPVLRRERNNRSVGFGEAKGVLFIEVSSFQGVSIREVPLYKSNLVPTFPWGPLDCQKVVWEESMSR